MRTSGVVEKAINSRCVDLRMARRPQRQWSFLETTGKRLNMTRNWKMRMEMTKKIVSMLHQPQCV
jgi:hypothetical protein